jgi:hypothetical protein
MILTISLLFIFIIVVVTLALSLKNLKKYNFGIVSLIIAACFLIIGIFLTTYSSKEISKALVRKSWPEVQAKVVEKNIAGKRAFNPQITCQYEIHGKDYMLITDLNTPGFGRKRSRRQTAEIILKDYPVGSEVRITYNPENPEEAYIRTGPFWSDYMQLSLGILILAPALYVILGIAINKFIIIT